METVKVRVTTKGEPPKYETAGAAGMDLRACLDAPVLIKPGKRELIPTGLRLELPEGYEAQVRARSGLAVKHGVGIMNGIGTIDSDYRGEVQVCLINLGADSFQVKNGDRIAQLVIARYVRAELEVCGALSDTERGDGGFGHTGT